jgi:thymidine phosphorylase
VVERADRHLPDAPVRRPVPAPRAGRVAAIATREIGLAVIGLGGGRTKPQGTIDHAVGLTDLAGLGSEVGAGEPLATVHARSEAAAERAVAAVQAAYRIGEGSAPSGDPILARIA